MTNDSCHPMRSSLGAYAMDRLSIPERARVDRHLRTCLDCSGALAEIEPVVELLPEVDPRRIDRPSGPRPEVATRLFARVAEERRARRQKKKYAVSGVVGIAAALLVAVLVVPPAIQSGPDGTAVAFRSTPANVTASSRIVDESWGSKIQLEVVGLTGRQTVWFEQPDGTRASAGSFEAGNGEKVDIELSTAFRAGDAVALCVSPPNQPAVLRAPLNGNGVPV